MKSKLMSGLLVTWKILWRSGLFLLAWGVFMAAFFVPVGPKLAIWEKTHPVNTRFYMDIAAALTILSATWFMTRFIDHRPLRTIGFSFDHFLRDFPIGFIVGSAWLGLSVGTGWMLGWISPAVPIGFSWSIFTGAAIAMLFNIFAQELILCGFIFQTIQTRTNTIIAMIVSSIVFSSLHAGAFKGEWLPAVNVFGAGLLFCLAYVITGNLWFPISIHYSWDVIIGPVLGLSESGIRSLGGNWKMFIINGPPLFVGGSFGLEGGVIVTITIFFFVVGMLLFQRHNVSNKERVAAKCAA
jgi:uncharacterized protein